MKAKKKVLKKKVLKKKILKKKKPAEADQVSLYLRLYVTGTSPNSLQAIANVEALCREHYAGAHTLEILDLLERPGQALADGVIVTPTLLRVFPPPIRRVVGNLSEAKEVLLALGGK